MSSNLILFNYQDAINLVKDKLKSTLKNENNYKPILEKISNVVLNKFDGDNGVIHKNSHQLSLKAIGFDKEMIDDIIKSINANDENIDNKLKTQTLESAYKKFISNMN